MVEPKRSGTCHRFLSGTSIITQRKSDGKRNGGKFTAYIKKTKNPKMGRPKAENPLDVDVKVRLDKETTDRLDAHCAATGKARATVIRAAIRKYLNI